MSQEMKPVDKDQVIMYAKVINKNITDEDKELLDFVVSEVIDRLYAYLNRTTLPTTLGVERILAKVVSGLFNKYTAEVSETDPNRAITSITDANGQAITYSEQVLEYLSTATDNEVFTGVTGLLARYRLVNVVV